MREKKKHVICCNWWSIKWNTKSKIKNLYSPPRWLDSMHPRWRMAQEQELAGTIQKCYYNQCNSGLNESNMCKGYVIYMVGEVNLQRN